MTTTWAPVETLMTYHPIFEGDAVFFKRQAVYKKFTQLFNFDVYDWAPYPHNMRRFLNGDRAFNAGLQFDTPAPSGAWPGIDHLKAFRNREAGRTVLLSMPYSYTPEKIDEYLQHTGAVWYEDPRFKFYSQNTMPILIMSLDTLEYYQSRGVIPSDFEIHGGYLA